MIQKKNTKSDKAVAEKVKSAKPVEKAKDGMEKAEEAKVELEKSQAEPDEYDGPCVISAEETPNINLSLEALIRENSWHHCD